MTGQALAVLTGHLPGRAHVEEIVFINLDD